MIWILLWRLGRDHCSENRKVARERRGKCPCWRVRRPRAFIRRGEGPSAAGATVCKEPPGNREGSRGSRRLDKIQEGRLRQKTAVTPGNTTDSTWGAPLATYDNLATAFLESLRSVGAFDAVLPSMRQVPLRTKLVLVSGGATGSIVNQGSIKPISKLELATGTLDEVKAVAVVIVSQELLRVTTADATGLFRSELQRAISAVTDTEFVSILTASAPVIAGSGDTLSALRADLRAAFNTLAGSSQSRYFILMSASTAVALSFLEDASDTFNAMTPNGGSIGGVPVVVTDAAANDIIVLDASQIAGASGTVDLGELRHASLSFDDDPSSPTSASTSVVSLWQNNQVAFTAERFFGAEKLRT